MPRSLLALLLASAPLLASAEELKGAQAEDATRQAANVLLKKVADKYRVDSAAARAWRHGEEDGKRYPSLYKLAGSAHLVGTEVNGEFSTTRTHKPGENGDKIVRRRSVKLDWQTQRGKLRVDDEQRSFGIGARPGSVLLTERADDGSRFTATLKQTDALESDRAFQRELRQTGIFGWGGSPLAKALALPRDVVRQLAAGTKFEIESSYQRTSAQAIPALPKDKRPPNVVSRERSYALKIGHSEHALSEAGYRALKARFRR